MDVSPSAFSASSPLSTGSPQHELLPVSDSSFSSTSDHEAQNDSAISQSPSGTSFPSPSLDNSSTSNDVNLSSATPHLCPVTSTPAEPSVVHTEDMLDNVKKALGDLDFHLDFST